MLLLLCCWIIAGITAEDTPKKHYREKNSTLCLNIGKPPPYHQLTWLFNNTAVFVGNEVRANYTDKMTFYPSNFSLCINKVTETDSGIYKVSILDSAFKSFVETHMLFVEGSVPTPTIRMSVIHANLSAGSCNITVNCSIQDDWMLSVCNEDRCRASQRSFGTVNITISTDNRSVICRGNNHVSTSTASENVEATCFKKPVPSPEDTTTPLITIIVAVIVCVAFVAFIVGVAKRCFLTKRNHHQETMSIVQSRQSQPVEVQPQPFSRASTSSSSQAEVSYENVEAARPSQTSSPAISPRQELSSKQSETVDTVYSLLQIPNGTTSEEHKTIGEASTSQPVTQAAEQPMQIDTVYSVLQKSKNLE